MSSKPNARKRKQVGQSLMPPKAVTSQHKGRVKGTQTAEQKGVHKMSNIYHVEPKGKREIVVLKGNTTIAESMCGNLYPSIEATNYDIGLIITLADLYDLFYIPLDKERSEQQ